MTLRPEIAAGPGTPAPPLGRNPLSTAALVLARAARRSSVVAWSVLALSGAATGVYLLSSSTLVHALVYVLTGTGCIAGIAVGGSRLPSASRGPWWWVLAAAGLFLGGAVARQLAADGPASYIADALSTAGGVALSLALVAWLR